VADVVGKTELAGDVALAVDGEAGADGSGVPPAQAALPAERTATTNTIDAVLRRVSPLSTDS
jgi:hypothetical protein